MCCTGKTDDDIKELLRAVVGVGHVVDGAHWDAADTGEQTYS